MVQPSDEEWRRIVQAIEESLPVYETVSERISLNRAVPARTKAIEYLTGSKKEWTLDLGVGPGTSTRMLLENGFEKIVGLEPSRLLLKHANQIFRAGFYPVLGVSEHMPFRDKSLGNVLTCFALRDVRDLDQSLDEIGRVTTDRGRLGIVDIGKPKGTVQRILIGFYIKRLMPLLSSRATRGKTRGNPFLMIIPTFDRLVSNETLVVLVQRVFGPVNLKKVMGGGLIVLLAERKRST